MRPFASLLLLAAAVCGHVFTSPLHAGEAAFTEDGNTVIALPHDGAKIWSISLADGKTTVVDLGKQIEGEDLHSISPAKEGLFWLATSKRLFLWKPGYATARKVLTLEHGEFTDINADPSSGDLLAETFGGESETDSAFHLRALPKGEMELVDAKDAPAMFSAVYDAEGRFFFSSDSDLWAGLTSTVEEGLSLDVWRAAPLAVLQYERNNPGSSFTLMDIAPAGKSLVMTVANEVEAFLVQIPKPSVHLGPEGPLEKLPIGVPARWKQAATVLQSLKVIPIKESLASIFNLCSSADESKVFFLTHSDEDGKKTFRLLDVKTGKIRVLGEAPGT
ncbi:hypothetical protein [Roseimicrobium sp. ORNL1]|uniref:hypothetical protein n=1 Tax=Roseimicrobium sp. ORNL1 TaxID=2711231 RepID=UPI0013E0F38D|nr:hypothetical protein [Roseimicrobium sp. ORNL1]QIF04086.1 hypothetical protein G5S37_22000 [Roseimicrobium sp. ORNL1]